MCFFVKYLFLEKYAKLFFIIAAIKWTSEDWSAEQSNMFYFCKKQKQNWFKKWFKLLVFCDKSIKVQWNHKILVKLMTIVPMYFCP